MVTGPFESAHAVPTRLLGATALLLVTSCGLTACGGGSHTRVVDESSDSSGGSTDPSFVAEVPTDLDGTQWHWVSAYCTEGPLDLAARGYSSTLRIAQAGASLDLVYDSAYVNEGCQQTIVQRVSPPESRGELRMEEIARVAVPSTSACFGQPEPPRPGELRRDGRRLEVLVQRSRWCGGFEVRMVFEPMQPTFLGDEEIARRYVAQFTRGDADAVASLFADTGSIVEPFTVTTTGDPYRHDGRAAVRTWFSEAFEGTPWRAMRILGFDHGERQLVMRWEYMDPRLADPLAGRNTFTIAGGEIFEAQVQLDGEPVLAN
ncbi:MAG: nuclear transport factor 2 family protein [Sandaracinus sp.]